jgi:hypothetical protein
VRDKDFHPRPPGGYGTIHLLQQRVTALKSAYHDGLWELRKQYPGAHSSETNSNLFRHSIVAPEPDPLDLPRVSARVPPTVRTSSSSSSLEASPQSTTTSPARAASSVDANEWTNCVGFLGRLHRDLSPETPRGRCVRPEHPRHAEDRPGARRVGLRIGCRLITGARDTPASCDLISELISE